MPPETDRNPSLEEAVTRYFDGCRARVPDFVRRQFGFRGTLRLHRQSLGWDILRAPVNVMLSPVYVLTRIAARALRLVGLRRAAAWLAGRRIFLTTALSRSIAKAMVVDLLDLPWDDRRGAPVPGGLARVLAAELGTAGVADPETHRIALSGLPNSLGTYAASRSAVSEMTAALGTLGVGAVTLHALTPGMISVAPILAGSLAQSAAIAAFPLGGAVGALWYGAFPAEASPMLFWGLLAALVALGSLVTAFAGLVADPLQLALGIHRRRLIRMINALEAEVLSSGGASFGAREHIIARLLDLADVGSGAVAALKG